MEISEQTKQIMQKIIDGEIELDSFSLYFTVKGDNVGQYINAGDLDRVVESALLGNYDLNKKIKNMKKAHPDDFEAQTKLDYYLHLLQSPTEFFNKYEKRLAKKAVDKNKVISLHKPDTNTQSKYEPLTEPKDMSPEEFAGRLLEMLRNDDELQKIIAEEDSKNDNK